MTKKNYNKNEGTKLTSLSGRDWLGRQLSRLALLSHRRTPAGSRLDLLLLGRRGGLQLLGHDQLRRVLGIVAQQIKGIGSGHLETQPL